MSKVEHCILQNPEEQNLKDFFLYFIVGCDGECWCEHNTENKGASTERLYHQKPVSFNLYVKSDLD